MNSASLYEQWEHIVKKAQNELENGLANIYVPYGHCCFGDTFISTNRLKNKAFYVEVDAMNTQDYKLPQIQGLHFEFTNVPKISPTKVYLRISLINTNIMDEAFEAFTVTVLNNIQYLDTSLEVLETISQIVVDYEQFFNSEKQRRLTRQEEQGLFGELLFLKEAISKKGEEVVDAWTGPDKNKHDFIFQSNCGVEIKTTSSQIQKNISISNENQLKFEDRNKLFLKLYVLESNPNGESIVDLYNEILESLSSVLIKKHLLQKILEFGILPQAYVPKYKFVNIESAIYLVDEKFPRISKASLANVIFDVKYKINVDSVLTFKGDIYDTI